jgi:hypothetical protein
VNRVAGRGLACITDPVAAGIADEQSLTTLAALRSSIVETDLGPAVLFREVERIVYGARS